MNKIISVFTILVIFLLISCGNKYKLQLDSPKTIQVSKSLKVSVVEKNRNPIDSVKYFIDGKEILNNESLDIHNYRLGKHAISATVYYAGQNKKLNNTIYFLAIKAPEIYKFEIINEFPHDKNAFTQGFEYYNGFFYESTGQRGKSTLRKTEIETGKILQKIDIDKKYFAEGMTIFNNKIYLLTWQNKVGFVYNLETFELERTFDYKASKEGWGLTHNNEQLIKTDGTERMWFLNPETLEEEKYIETYTNKSGDRVTNTEWHNIVLWRGLAEIADRYLKKGNQVYIEFIRGYSKGSKTYTIHIENRKTTTNVFKRYSLQI